MEPVDAATKPATKVEVIGKEVPKPRNLNGLFHVPQITSIAECSDI